MNVLLSVFVGLAVSAPVVAGLTGGILGDVDDNGRVDMMDGVFVHLYILNPSTTVPGDISLGDINADGRIDSTDAQLIAVYISNPSDPALPPAMGRPSGEACSVGLELSPGQSCRVDIPIENGEEYRRLKVRADGKGYYDHFKTLGIGVMRSTRSINSSKRIDSAGFRASRIADTSRWRIDALP